MAVDSAKKCERTITVRTIGGPEIPILGDYDFVLIRDITCTYRLAKLSIRDKGGGMREILPLTGNEIFRVYLRNQASSSAPVEIDFEATKIQESLMHSFTASDRGVTIHLVEYPLFRLLSDKKSRGWNENSVGQIVEQILFEAVMGGAYNALNISGHDTVLPRFIQPATWTNLKTIKYLARRTEGGPHYLFPESFYDQETGVYRNKINFNSTQKMALANPARTLRLVSDGDLRDSEHGSLDIITDFQPEVGNKTDLLSDMTTSHISYYNYETGKYGTETYSYQKFLKDGSVKKLGKKALYNLSIQDAVVSNSVCGNKKLKNGKPEDVQRKLKNSFRHNFQRQLVLNLMCLGDEQRSVGEKVTLLFPSSDDDPSEILDGGLSGEWIVRRIESVTGPDDSFLDYILVERNAYFESPKEDLPEVSRVD